MNEALRLLHKLNLHIRTTHLDMGGQNRYALSAKAHKVIDEIKLYLSENPKQFGGNGVNGNEYHLG